LVVETLNRMNTSKLINWAEVSRLLSGNRSVVTKKRMPEKHKQTVKELLDLVSQWYSEHASQT